MHFGYQINQASNPNYRVEISGFFQWKTQKNESNERILLKTIAIVF